MLPRDPYRALIEVGADLGVSMELVGILPTEDDMDTFDDEERVDDDYG